MIHRSPYPDVAIPDVALTPWLLEAAERRGDFPALVDGPSGRTITSAGWARAVRRAAFGLHRRGLRKGDVVGIYSPNLPEYAVAFHAATLLGGVVTTANPLFTADELAQQLFDCRARLLVTVPPFLEKARAAAAKAGVEEVFVFGEAEGATPFAALLAEEGGLPAVRIDPANDVVALPYSSGTTGLPKGVMLTHRNLVANIEQCCALPGSLAREGDRVIGVLPFFHIYGLVVIMNAGLRVGATIVTLPRFEMEPFLETLQKYAVTYANVVPPIVLGLAKHPAVDKYRLGLRVVFSGAAPLSEALARAASARLGCPVLQGYGLTETSPVTHVGPSEPDRQRPGAAGLPIPNTECKVVDLASGEALPAGQEGEICIRGPQVMKGYLGRPDATAAMIDGEGWLHTGDVGYADRDGYFYVVDRVKELIKYKGCQVPPAELEALLLTHPAVADAAVIPKPDEEAGEIPKAFVVLKGEATPEALMAYVAERVAPTKKIRALEVVEQIPRSASGKILRRVLVERERASAKGETA
ncbi:MAG TPA: AMP-binding protein [Vicinamibacteria bacterium]|nr:AMP-binding protein [Vicinamibacteria bacterium]